MDYFTDRHSKVFLVKTDQTDTLPWTAEIYILAVSIWLNAYTLKEKEDASSSLMTRFVRDMLPEYLEMFSLFKSSELFSSLIPNERFIDDTLLNSFDCRAFLDDFREALIYRSSLKVRKPSLPEEPHNNEKESKTTVEESNQDESKNSVHKSFSQEGTKKVDVQQSTQDESKKSVRKQVSQKGAKKLSGLDKDKKVKDAAKQPTREQKMKLVRKQPTQDKPVVAADVKQVVHKKSTTKHRVEKYSRKVAAEEPGQECASAKETLVKNISRARQQEIVYQVCNGCGKKDAVCAKLCTDREGFVCNICCVCKQYDSYYWGKQNKPAKCNHDTTSQTHLNANRTRAMNCNVS